MKAKTINTLTVLGAIIWTITMSIWKALHPEMGLTVAEIIKVAFSLVGIVGGITGSIWLDKITEAYRAVNVSRETTRKEDEK